MNYTENNKLIAEFMGMVQGHPNKSESRWGKDWFEKLTIDGNDFESGRRHTHLNFHTDWNWLMEVLRKIDSLNYEMPDDSNLIGDISCALVNLDIEETFLATVEFIKWYNENHSHDGK